MAQVMAEAVARITGKDAFWTTKTAIESPTIVILCIIAAIIYGILHDQVTARWGEYFTIDHPQPASSA